MAKKAAKTGKKKKAAAAADGNPMYKDMEEKLGQKSKEPYRMSNEYPVNTVIEHPKFGVGFVFAVTPEKIDVAFHDGNRSLVQNRK